MNALNSLTTRIAGLAVIAVTASVPTLSSLTAQTPAVSGGLAAARENAVQLFSADGRRISFAIQTNGFPTVQVSPIGPTVIITDTNSTRFFDRYSQPLGGLINKTGVSQYVVVNGTCIVVVDDDRVRIYNPQGAKQGSDITKTGNMRQQVRAENGRIVVVDSDRTRMFGKNGSQIGSNIMTPSGSPAVVFNGSRLVIQDGNRVLIYDGDGNKKSDFMPSQSSGTWQIINDTRYVVVDDDEVQLYDEAGQPKGAAYSKTGMQQQRAVICDDRVIIIDDDRVRVTDLEGALKGAVTTSGYRANVETTHDRIIIADNASTRVFRKTDMSAVFDVAKTGTDRQLVTVHGDRIIITDQDRTRMFDSDGAAQGGVFMKTGSDTQRVHVEGDRIGLVDSDRVRIFDLAGQQVGQDIPYVDDLQHGLQMFSFALTITDFDKVRIFDRNGAQQGQSISVSSDVQHTQVSGNNRIFVTHDNNLRIYKPNGSKVGDTLTVGNNPEIAPITFESGDFASIGTGCGGLDQYYLGVPAIGRTLTYQIGHATPGAFAQLNLGLSNTDWAGFTLPFDLNPYGAPGCIVYNDALVGLPATIGANAYASVNIPVPYDLSLIGLTFYTQWQVIDPTANALGILVTKGMETRIGGGY